MNIESKIDQVKGVGPALTESFTEAGIITIKDLLMYFPRTYNDYSHLEPINKIRPGPVTIKVMFVDMEAGHRTGGLHISKASAIDETGSVSVSWFNQPYRTKSLKTGVEYYVSGVLDFKYGRYQLINPSIEQVSDLPKQTAKILATYPEKKTLKSRQIRKIINEVIVLVDQIKDPLPDEIVKSEFLMPKSEAIKELHLPSSQAKLQQAKDRLGFEEVFELQLAALVSKRQAQSWLAPKLTFDSDKTKVFLSGLKFELTGAQKKAAWQILQDIESTSPMNRMLQGDVGSGKTVVAGMAIEQCLRAGKQAALMAPTEVLAVQHAKTLNDLLPPDSIVLLTSAVKPAQKREILKRAEVGEPMLFVGTHALIQQAVSFSQLGLAIIDEQHRFGVAQRQKLLNGQEMPHLLSMTATPIPRSLALTVYGDLDVSVIDEMPPGRQPVETKVLPFTSVQEVDRMIDETVARGEQVYIVCPLIEESDKMELKNVEDEFRRVRKDHAKARSSLLHGRLKSDEKQKILNDFKNRELDILVSTTVVEVGVDVPGATLMIIEGAERFGLAQLHQLRGRVGRSDLQAHCMLVTSPGMKPSARLRAMEQTNSGFKLAEIDLKLRGPGAVYGTRQHGELDLRMASLSDTKLISHIRQVAKAFLDTDVDLSQYPILFSRIKQLRSLTQLN